MLSSTDSGVGACAPLFGGDPVASRERAGERCVGAVAHIRGDQVDRVPRRAEVVGSDLEAELRDVGGGRVADALGESLGECRPR